MQRPFIIWILGLPAAGKSELIRKLQKRFTDMPKRGEVPLVVQTLSADAPRYRTIKRHVNGHRENEHAATKKLAQRRRSATFLGILLDMEIACKQSIGDVVLVEQDAIFTSLAEAHGHEMPAYVLEYFVSGIKAPDLVVYLSVTPEKAQSRRATKKTRDITFMSQMGEALEKIYQEHMRHWLRIDTNELTQHEVSDLVWEAVSARYESGAFRKEDRRELIFEI